MQKPRTQRRAEDRALAKKYNVSDRTVRSWIAAGAPLDNPDAMPRWIMDHQAHGLERNPLLPHGLEHTNALRFMAEQAAAHFLYESLEVFVPRLVDALIEDHGMDPFKARGTGMMLWHGMFHQLKHWTMGDRYNLALMASCGQSLDSLMKEIALGWKEKSAPPSHFPKQPVPAAVQKLFKANGGDVFAFAEIVDGGIKGTSA